MSIDSTHESPERPEDTGHAVKRPDLRADPVTTPDAALSRLRTPGMVKDTDGQTLELIENLNGYVLSECLVPEQRLIDMSMRCEGANADGDGFICRGYMAQGDRLHSVTIAVRRSGACELLDADLVAQILKPESAQDVLARLNRL